MKKKISITHDCIIIGGGPGGLVCSIYLQRFHRNILLIDRGDARVRNAPKIRNLVGYADGISGHQLLLRLRKQTLQYKTQIIMGEAIIYRRHFGFEVTVNGNSFFSKYVILATGFKDKQLPQLDFINLCRKGILAYCPICDGFEHLNQSVGVFINSSSGFHKIKFLYHFTKRLHVILTKDISIPARHLEKIKKFNVKIHQGIPQKLIHNEKRNSLVVKLKNQRPFELDMAYVMLGLKVSNEAIQHLHGLRRTKEGFILVNGHQQTSIKGLYAVGDCVKALAQVSVAIGHAAVAATHVHNSLNKSQSS